MDYTRDFDWNYRRINGNGCFYLQIREFGRSAAAAMQGLKRLGVRLRNGLPADRQQETKKQPNSLAKESGWEATTGFEPVIRVLQTHALPLGYVAIS